MRIEDNFWSRNSNFRAAVTESLAVLSLSLQAAAVRLPHTRAFCLRPPIGQTHPYHFTAFCVGQRTKNSFGLAVSSAPPPLKRPDVSTVVGSSAPHARRTPRIMRARG